MSRLGEILAHLARTPEEQAEFWFRRQRREYDRLWVIEESLAVLEQSDDTDDVARVEQGRAEQHRIHYWQAETGVIRDRLADELK